MTTKWLIPVVALLALTIVSCSSASAPAPGKPASSPSPAAAPAKAGEPSAPIEKPSASTASQSPASSDWRADWDKWVAAAKTEGKVVVAGPRGDVYRNAFEGFGKAFPGVEVEYTGVEGSDFGPKIIAEREAGKFLWDIHIGGATTGQSVLKPKGSLDPEGPVLRLPEVVDDAAWVGGLNNAWMDSDGSYIFGFEARVVPPVWINRDLVSESDLKSIDQLLEPKWKGKIVSSDPRRAGTISAAAAYLIIVKGEDWLRKLYSQDLVLNTDERAAIESVIRGIYPMVMGVDQAYIEEYQKQGLGKGIKALDPDPDGTLGQLVVSARGNLMLINKAPHPNAARLFINWLLSKEAQKAYTETTGLNSRRIDVQGPPQTAPKPNVKIVDVNREQNLRYNSRGREIASEVIK